MSVTSTDKQTLRQESETLHVNLLSSVSHDLKTPLACIIGALEIHQQLKNTLAPHHKETLITTAIDEARRLDSFISNIIDMSKLENDVSFTYETANIVQLVKQCIEQLQVHMRARKIDIKSAAKVMAEVNVAWINRAITLLLDNAARYTPDNTKIVVAVSDDKSSCIIAVRDYGAGIPKKLHAGIFDKHTRSERLDSKIAGTGLGLPICKAIVQAHGGSIHIESPKDGGTVFTLTLPLTQKQKKTP